MKHQNMKELTNRNKNFVKLLACLFIAPFLLSLFSYTLVLHVFDLEVKDHWTSKNVNTLLRVFGLYLITLIPLVCFIVPQINVRKMQIGEHQKDKRLCQLSDRQDIKNNINTTVLIFVIIYAIEATGILWWSHQLEALANGLLGFCLVIFWLSIFSLPQTLRLTISLMVVSLIYALIAFGLTGSRGGIVGIGISLIGYFFLRHNTPNISILAILAFILCGGILLNAVQPFETIILKGSEFHWPYAFVLFEPQIIENMAKFVSDPHKLAHQASPWDIVCSFFPVLKGAMNCTGFVQFFAEAYYPNKDIGFGTNAGVAMETYFMATSGGWSFFLYLAMLSGCSMVIASMFRALAPNIANTAYFASIAISSYELGRVGIQDWIYKLILLTVIWLFYLLVQSFLSTLSRKSIAMQNSGSNYVRDDR